MKCVAAVALFFISSVFGFQPAAVKRTERAAVVRAASELESIGGFSAETGNKPFDPLNIASWAPAERLRASELANGRVAMLAVVGWVFPEIVGKFGSDDVTSTHALDGLLQADPLWWIQVLFLCGVVESNMYKHYVIEKKGNPFFDPLNLYPKDEEGRKAMELKELKNGRAAMIAFAAMASHLFIPGSVPGYLLPF